jgi:hypothetical protein
MLPTEAGNLGYYFEAIHPDREEWIFYKRGYIKALQRYHGYQNALDLSGAILGLGQWGNSIMPGFVYSNWDNFANPFDPAKKVYQTIAIDPTNAIYHALHRRYSEFGKLVFGHVPLTINEIQSFLGREEAKEVIARIGWLKARHRVQLSGGCLMLPKTNFRRISLVGMHMMGKETLTKIFARRHLDDEHGIDILAEKRRRRSKCSIEIRVGGLVCLKMFVMRRNTKSCYGLPLNDNYRILIDEFHKDKFHRSVGKLRKLVHAVAMRSVSQKATSPRIAIQSIFASLVDHLGRAAADRPHRSFSMNGIDKFVLNLSNGNCQKSGIAKCVELVLSQNVPRMNTPRHACRSRQKNE